MRHPDASLAAYVEGTATARERATAEAHLASCPVCRREVKRAKAALAALVALPDVDAPPLDAGAIIERVASARAKRPAGGQAKISATLDSMSTREWAPATPTAVAEEADQVEEVEEAHPPSPVVQDLEVARRKRERDRSRALRVAEAALGAAAILGAVVLFIGLRNQPAGERASTAGAPAPSPALDTSGVVDYTPVTLTAHAKELAAQIDSSGALFARSEAAQQASAGPSTLPKSETDRGVSCIRKATSGLVSRSGLYELQQAKYLGRSAWIGAFITDADTKNPVLLVIAVPIDRCTPEQVQQLIQEQLKPRSSPASP